MFLRGCIHVGVQLAVVTYSSLLSAVQWFTVATVVQIEVCCPFGNTNELNVEGYWHSDKHDKLQ